MIDIGANLCDKSFQPDLPQVIERAQAAGVSAMVVTGTDVVQSNRAEQLAGQYPGLLWATAGVHPHQAKDCDEHTIASLRKNAQAPHVVAIGECGLDYNRNFSPVDVQCKWFEAQVELAAELSLPLFVHERDAVDDTLAILKRHRANLSDVVIHCFTGDAASLRAYLKLDFHIGITGWICDERRGLHLHDIISEIPEDRLMIETDAPYLTPRTIRPRPKTRRNEPGNLRYVLATVAQCLGKSEDEVRAATSETAKRFFSL